MSELKPCPFCGGEASMRLYYGGRFGVECDGCGVRGLVLDDEQDAARMWNTRTERTCTFKPFKNQRSKLLSEGVCSECSGYMHSEMLYCPNCGAKVVDE